MQPGQLPHGTPRALRVQVPQRAIERIACPARRQQRCQLLARDTALDHLAIRLDRATDRFRIVIEIVNAIGLAASREAIVRERHQRDRALGERVPRDTERRREPQAFDGMRQGQAPHRNAHVSSAR